MFSVRDCCEQPLHFIRTQDRGQTLGRSREGDLLDRPGAAERDSVEKAQRTDRLVEGAPGGVLVLDEMDLVGTDLLRTELLRRLTEVASEAGDMVDVRLLRSEGVVAQTQILEHPLAKRGHERLLCTG
jgi:hypothetical protein